MAPPRPVWRSLWLAKAGSAPADYEDAFAADETRARFAVADGATEASFAAEWARMMAAAFVGDDGTLGERAWLESAQQKWIAEVGNRPLPWYAEAKRDEGAFAALIGVCFLGPSTADETRWQALAVGDCCLFHIRGGRLLTAFPISRVEDFDSRPELLCSRGANPRGRRATGRWKPGDRFLLMSDALARWFLVAEQSGCGCGEVAALLGEPSPDSAWPAWIDERRRSGALKNDDVTLVSIDL